MQKPSEGLTAKVPLGPVSMPRLPWATVVGVPFLALLLSLLGTALLVVVTGLDGAKAVEGFWFGAFGDLYAIGDGLVAAVPLVLTGLSFLVCVRGGLINVGAEGQLYVGALAAAAVALAMKGGAGGLSTILAMLCAGVAGALWGGLAGYLRAYRGANEVISTIMLNHVAILLVSYMVRGPLQEPRRINPYSDIIAVDQRIPLLLEGTRLHWGLVLAVLMAVVVYCFLWRTRLGYELRVVGENLGMARYAGLPAERRMVQALAIAGALAGLAGAIEVLGVRFRLIETISPGYGFNGIAVSLLGMNHPLGTVIAAVGFGFLRTGITGMQRATGAPAALLYVTQALVVALMVLGNSRRVREAIGRWIQGRERRGRDGDRGARQLV